MLINHIIRRNVNPMKKRLINLKNIILRRLLFGLRILLRSKRYDYSTNCPYCNNKSTQIIQRKYLILELRECKKCNLRFRFPKDSVNFSEYFYNKIYKQENNLVTSLPTLTELNSLIKGGFKDTDKDFSKQISALKHLHNTKGKLFEYGSSWGYFLYQCSKSGIDCSGLEISKPRAEYGIKNLNVKIYTDYTEVPDSSFEIIYSCHVLEHIANLQEAFSLFKRILLNNGLLIIECPNCSSASAKRQGVYWGPMIGEVHVNALTPDFFQKVLSEQGFTVKMTTDLKEITSEDTLFTRSQDKFDLSGDNLIVIAKPSKK